MKDIQGYEGRYQVTEDGRIWSIKRNIFLKEQYDKDGYACVNLYDDDHKLRRFFIHRLVALAYVPNPEGKATVNHLDECKTNNHYTNLAWATQKEQNLHGTRIERAAESHKKPVRCVETGVVYESAKAAADDYDTYRECIVKVLKGRQKTHRGLHWEYAKEDVQ